MITAEKKKLTYQDYLKFDDDKRYELVNGELFEMSPSPTPEYQRISREIEYLIIKFLKENNIGEVFDAPLDIVFDEETVLQPDLIYVSQNNLNIIKDRIYGIPDLVVEIVSSSSINYDNRIKFELYEKYKVKEYWIVDPKYKMIEIFTLENDKYNSYCSVIEEGEIASKIIEGFKFNIKEIFG